MPIYEYDCTKCDRRFESIVVGTVTVIRCPRCKSAKSKRVVSLPAPAQFKGSGFYATDYKGKK